MLEFYSIDDSKNEVHYMSSYERQCDTFIFDDKSAENTKVSLTIGTISRIKREGNITMDFWFDKDNVTQGIYENNMGLSVMFTIKTKELSLSNNIFFLSYDLYIDSDKISEHLIKIKFF
ncbi:MAG: DUF1934 family protein [Acholeplasmatales bacterium]|nr:DUF1934 family protein [Acholeplasmatales bacterium]